MRAAGAALGVNHATLSRRLAALEARLEAPLLVRAGRGVALTAHGARLAQVAARMDAARAQTGEVPEWVGVRAPAPVWPALAAAVASARQACPALRIRPGDDVVLHLSEPLQGPAERVGAWRLVPAGPPAGWVAGPGWLRQAWRDAHLVEPVVAHAATESQVHALVAAGVGASLLPPGLAGPLPLRSDLPPLEAPLWLARSGDSGRAADALVDQLRATLNTRG